MYTWIETLQYCPISGPRSVFDDFLGAPNFRKKKRRIFPVGKYTVRPINRHLGIGLAQTLGGKMGG